MRKFVMAIALLMLFSCNNRNFKEYIEKGFSVPEFESNVYFTNYKEGNGKKIYVPSEEDIEVRFAITNKYNFSLKAELSIPEAQKELFEKVPTVTSIDLSKLVISFKFKKIAEPKASNAFLGDSVPIQVKLFDVTRARPLETRVINANCNTAPLAIPESDITYNLQEDEYIIHLPKNGGKHEDLKQVKIEASTKKGGKKKEKIVSIEEPENQDKNYTLKIKGFLEAPSGEREIKVTVYDKAGISSAPENKNGKLIFANITLLPPTKQIRFKDSKEKGIPLPKIKELEEFFIGDDWKSEGYEVEYIMPTGTSFVYDKEANIIKNTTTTSGEHEVKVVLKHSSGNSATASYMVNILSGENAELNKEELLITDETDYQGKIGKALVLDASKLNFVEVSGVHTASFYVPYTGYETDLKTKIVAFDEDSKVKDLSGMGDANEKEFEIELLKDLNRNASIEFKVVSESGNTTKSYKINFIREEAFTVQLKLSYRAVGSERFGGKIICNWDYGTKTHTDTDSSFSILVAKGAKLKFSVEADNGAKISSCTSDDAEHDIFLSGREKIEFELKANKNFILEVGLAPETSVKWEDYKKAGISEGYDSGNISYNDVSGADKNVRPNLIKEYIVLKGSDVTFKINNLLPTYNVKAWKVDAEEISESTGSYELSSDKKTLKIKNVQGNKVVSVLTEVFKCKVSWSVEGGNGTIKAKKDLVPISTSTYNIEKGGNMTFTPKPATGFKVKGWKINNNSYTSPTTTTNGIQISSSNWELYLGNIQKDSTVVLLLEKEKHKLTVKIEVSSGSLQDFKVKISRQDGASISPDGASISPDGASINLDEVSASQVYHIEHGTVINFEAVVPSSTNHEIDKWTFLNPGSTETELASSDNKTKTSLSIEKEVTVKLKIKQITSQKVKLTWQSTPLNKLTGINIQVGGTSYSESGSGHIDNIDVGKDVVFECQTFSDNYKVEKITIDGKDATTMAPNVDVESNKRKLIIRSINKNMVVVFYLFKPQVKFEVKALSNVDGKLKITKIVGVHEASNNIGKNNSNTYDIVKNMKFKLEVLSLGTRVMVVGWSDGKGNYKTANPWVTADGKYYSEKIENFVPNEDGEVITLHLAKVSSLKFDKPKDSSNSDYGGTYTIALKKSLHDTNAEHFFLPINGIAIDKQSGGRTIYIVKGTTINIKVTNNSNNRIRKWEPDFSSRFIIGALADWNEHNSGKNDFDYTCDYDAEVTVIPYF
ncbi:MAG: hypothetical protein ACTTKH_06665 [Treponema sp.]